MVGSWGGSGRQRDLSLPLVSHGKLQKLTRYLDWWIDFVESFSSTIQHRLLAQPSLGYLLHLCTICGVFFAPGSSFGILTELRRPASLCLCLSFTPNVRRHDTRSNVTAATTRVISFINACRVRRHQPLQNARKFRAITSQTDLLFHALHTCGASADAADGATLARP